MNIAAILATKGSRVVTVQPEHTIRHALRLLADHNIGALVVVDDAEAPVGILTERDIVREAARSEQLFVGVVRTLMTREMIIGTPQDDLAAVGRTMTERRIRHLPIVDGGRLVGIVSIGDVVKAQRDQYQGEVDTLQTQILENTA